MADVRSTRGSKTAALVMLVVFLQVLVVAILGLGAISRDRKEGLRKARDDAKKEARGALEDVVRRAEEEVQAEHRSMKKPHTNEEAGTKMMGDRTKEGDYRTRA